MTDKEQNPSGGGHHLAAVGLVAGGVAILASIGVYVWLTFGFQPSATSSLPVENMGQGVAVLTPFVLLALLMIGYGRRMLRKE
jgi:hypothetical protein